MVAKLSEKLEALVQSLLNGSRRAAALVITMVENQSAETNELMKLIYPHTGKSMVVGVTGAAGSGKSSLITHLIRKFRDKGKRVGVVAVDPSSPFSGGAFLGDRIRFQQHALDEGVYIRSMSSRGYLGGLARSTSDVVRIMEAIGNDLVIVETLGAGQDEMDIIHVAQTCILVLTPNMGDDIQAMKAGIMEVADIVVLNKADLDGAVNCLRNLEATIHMAMSHKDDGWAVPRVIPTVATAAKTEDLQGIDELVEAISTHQAYLHESLVIDRIQAKRIEQELGLVFRDEVEKFIFKGLSGTGRKRQYIKGILEGRTDPYSVVEDVLTTFLNV